MSIDGIKIMDSDLANDIYSEFMSLYDENYPISEIKNKINQWESNLVDEIETEIFLTTFGLSLWEIGEPTEDIIKRMEELASEKKSEELWKAMDESLSVERKKEIQKLIIKISIPRKTPRLRKKYRQVKNYIFSLGDCLAIKNPNDTYLICIMANTFQNKNSFNYGFAFVTETFHAIPEESTIVSLYVYGRKVPSTFDKKGYYLGFDYSYVEHSDLLKFKDCVASA